MTYILLLQFIADEGKNDNKSFNVWMVNKERMTNRKKEIYLWSWKYSNKNVSNIRSKF